MILIIITLNSAAILNIVKEKTIKETVLYLPLKTYLKAQDYKTIIIHPVLSLYQH